MSRKAIIYQSGDYVALEDESGDYSATVRFKSGSRKSREELADDAMKVWGYTRIDGWKKNKSWMESKIEVIYGY